MHNREDDAWMILRGKVRSVSFYYFHIYPEIQVYNVTEYLKFHPGGVDELMKAVGRDGTSLFSSVFSLCVG